MNRRLAIVLSVLLLALFAAGCGEEEADDASTSGGPPTWVQEVFPEPGAVATVPDAVEVDHAITSPNQDVRLVVDGVDVTTYAAFEAGKLRYESGAGPVMLSSGNHTATVQRVLLRQEETRFRVLDSFSWEFRVG